MQIQPPPPKRSRREIRDARLPLVPPPLPRLRLITQEGDGHEGPSGAAREEVEDTNQRTQPTEQSSGHQLDEKLKLLYYSNFVLHFGVSKTMIAAVDDLLEVQGGERNKMKLGSGVRQTVSDICAKYDVKFYYCNCCDGILPSKSALCSNGSCRLQGVPCKRSRRQARNQLATVKIYPQLVEVLRTTIDTLAKVHENIHCQLPSSPQHASCPDSNSTKGTSKVWKIFVSSISMSSSPQASMEFA